MLSAGVLLALRLLSLHRVLSASYTDHFLAILHPLPGTCFPSHSDVSASISVSAFLFRTLRVHVEDVEYEMRLNDQLAAAAGLDSRPIAEGYSVVVTMPGLQDGEYDLHFTLFLPGTGAGSRRKIATTRSRFILDNRFRCQRADLLRANGTRPPSLPPELHWQTPAKQQSETSEEEDVWGRRLQDGELGIVNLALAARASMSSEYSPQHTAEFAVDGAVISSPGEDIALPAQTLAEPFTACPDIVSNGLHLEHGWMCGAWLSIDLGESVQVETVDVLGALEAGTIGSYPEVKGGDMLAPFAVVLLDQEDRRSKPREDKDQNARLYGREGRNREPAEPKIEDEHVQWAGAGHSFVSGKVYLEEEGSLSENMYLLPAGGVRASQVVIVLLRNERVLDTPSDTGFATLRALAVTEVEVWAWSQWECNSHCVFGDCDDVGRCTCWSGDLIGPHCTRNVLHSLSHLPPKHPLERRHRAGRCGDDDGSTQCKKGSAKEGHSDPSQEEEDEKQAGRLALDAGNGGWYEASLVQECVTAVGRAQNPPTCSPETAMEVNWDNSGLSAMLFFISGLIHVGVSLSKAATLSDAHGLVFASCPAMDFSCFFLPFSNCTPASIRSASTDTRQEQPILDDGSEWNVKGGFPVPAEEAENIGWSSENVENRFWPKGRFWYRMALMQYVFRLQPSVRESLALETAMEDIGFDHARERVIGWHVRLNVQDVLRIGRGPTLQRHIHALRTVASRYGISRVFVATDDPAVIDNASQLAPELAFMHFQFNRTMLSECGGKTNDCWLEGRLGRGELDADEVTRSWLMDVLLLSHAHAFVGQWGSNLSRLAYLLAVNRRHTLLPFISVDGPWRYTHLPMGSFA